MMTLSRHFHRMRGCKIMQLSLVAILLVKRNSGGGGSAERMMSLYLPCCGQTKIIHHHAKHSMFMLSPITGRCRQGTTIPIFMWYERLRLSVTKLLFLTVPNTSSVFERRMKNSGEQGRSSQTRIFWREEIVNRNRLVDRRFCGKKLKRSVRKAAKWKCWTGGTSDKNSLLLYCGNVELRLMRSLIIVTILVLHLHHRQVELCSNPSIM